MGWEEETRLQEMRTDPEVNSQERTSILIKEVPRTGPPLPPAGRQLAGTMSEPGNSLTRSASAFTLDIPTS